MIRLAATIALVLSVLGATCEGGTGPVGEVRDDLEAARARWEAEGPSSYRLTLHHDCFCAEDYRGPVVVDVRDDEIVTRVYQTSGQPVPVEPAAFFPNVEGLFEFLEEALAQDPHTVRAEFHPELGYPTEMWIDYNQSMADEEQGYTVVSLEPTS